MAKKLKNAPKQCTTLLLCEGNDCANFFIQVIEKLDSADVKLEKTFILDVEGIEDKAKFEDIKLRQDYSQFDTIVYVRDSEYPDLKKKSDSNKCGAELAHYNGVISKIKSRFKSIGLTAPDKPLELLESSGKKCGIR